MREAEAAGGRGGGLAAAPGAGGGVLVLVVNFYALERRSAGRSGGRRGQGGEGRGRPDAGYGRPGGRRWGWGEGASGIDGGVQARQWVARRSGGFLAA
jgi:hypothetical protein